MLLGRIGVLQALLLAIILSACSSAPKAPDLNRSVREALDKAGFTKVSVSQDRERAVITLKGGVASEGDKALAESIAKAAGVGEVIANEIAVLPPGAEDVAKSVNANQDYLIRKQLDAELAQHTLNDRIKYEVKNGVVTLRGTVLSTKARSAVERIAATIPNVTQVVNELEVKSRNATSAP